MKILAVDVAAKASGFALFDGRRMLSHGVISIRKLDAGHEWLWELYQALQQELPWDGVEAVVAEFDQNIAAWKTMNVKAKRRMYSAVDALILAKFDMVDADFHEVTPRSWQKQMLSGYPGYPKQTKIASIGLASQMWPQERWTEHDADAALMGLWWTTKTELERA